MRSKPACKLHTSNRSVKHSDRKKLRKNVKVSAQPIAGKCLCIHDVEEAPGVLGPLLAEVLWLGYFTPKKGCEIRALGRPIFRVEECSFSVFRLTPDVTTRKVVAEPEARQTHP
jgi:hypothetical protein